MNSMLGLIFAFFTFVFGLWGIVTSYQPNPITAVVFFVGASCAAFAFIVSFLFALVKVAKSNANHDAYQQQQHDLNMHNLPQDQFDSMHPSFMVN